MLKKPAPDFTAYSLALLENDRIIHTSTHSGLRPLVECIREYRSRARNCVLYDKVIGLAAARLVAHAGMISAVVTKLASAPAAELLAQQGIPLTAERTVPNILRKDGQGICPMELRALDAPDNASFAELLEKIYY